MMNINFLVKDKENGDVEIIYDGIAKADDLTISSKKWNIYVSK